MKKYPSAFKEIKSNPFVLENARNLKDDKNFRQDLWQAHQDNKGGVLFLFR